MKHKRDWHIRCASFLVLLLLHCISVAPASAHQASSPSFEATMQLHRHTPTCSLLFQTPACTQPAVFRPRKASAILARPSSCGVETCSIDGSSHAPPSPAGLLVNAQAKRDVRARATQTSSTSTSTDTKWWKKQGELWVDVHSEEEFYREISSGDRLVFVGKHLQTFAGQRHGHAESVHMT
jgi:hypothetical protein